jgi:hypothetical protein
MRTVVEICNAIEKVHPEAQREVLRALRDLNVTAPDLAWARLAESAFGFWDNSEDAIYDSL